MAAINSFDITTGVDLQEVDNAVNQARKEIGQRYDFKGSRCAIDFDRGQATLTLTADDDFRMRALVDVLTERLVRRKVPVKNVTLGPFRPAAGDTVRCLVTLTQGIATDVARGIVKAIKDQGFKKVQAAIQGDQIRVSAPSRDELQHVMAFLRQQDFGIELTFGNYRG